MAIIIFSKYGLKTASTRCRMYRVAQYLSQKNCGKISLFPLLEYPFFSKKFSFNYFKFLTLFFISIIYRIYYIIKFGFIKKNNIILLQEELLPGFPSFLQLYFFGFLKVNNLIVMDVDDGLHLRKNILSINRKANSFELLVQNSDILLCGSPILKIHYLSNLIKHPKVIFLPTIPDNTSLFSKEPIPFTQTNKRERSNSYLRIGWIGSQSTSVHISLLISQIESYFSCDEVRFFLVGSKMLDSPLIEYQLPWSNKSEVKLLNDIDLGIMPLSNTKFNYFKCSFKLLQYMSVGIPYVATPIGFNKKLLENNFSKSAISIQDWIEAIKFYRSLDVKLYSTLKTECRKFYLDNYHPKNFLPGIYNSIIKPSI